MTDRTIISVSGLSKVFRPRREALARLSTSRRAEVVAVDNVSLDIQKGEFLAISGASGSGKSTLARLMVRLIEPSRGDVCLAGESVFGMDSARVSSQLRRKVRLIFQHPDASLNPARTVRQTLHKSLRLHGNTNQSAWDEESSRLLEAVALTDVHLHRFPDQLSGGEKRRVSIAAALATEPHVIIGDEMLSGLDALTRWQILGLLLRQQQKRGLTVILMTHQLDVVRPLCDRLIKMENGRMSGS